MVNWPIKSNELPRLADDYCRVSLNGLDYERQPNQPKR